MAIFDCALVNSIILDSNLKSKIFGNRPFYFRTNGNPCFSGPGSCTSGLRSSRAIDSRT